MSLHGSEQPDGTRICTYAARRGRTALRVRVAIDTAPQAYFRFERAVIEQGQAYEFGAVTGRPVIQNGIALGAAWVPIYHWLLATDGERLFTITALERRRTARSELAVLRAVARRAVRSSS